MKSTELKEKLDKAIERVHKIEGTIERHKKQADKKLTELKKHNWSENPMDHSGTGNHEAYWLACEYQDKLSDMKNSQKNLIKAQEIAKNWDDKYNKQLELERHYQFEMPEAFKTLKDILVDNWTKFDLEEQEQYYKKYKELGYRVFIQRYSRNRWDYLRSHNEQSFREDNEKAAENWILDLYNRIKRETGEIVTWNNITVTPKGLNGYVKGKLGAVNVETIMAGGYNIQRLHYRVILHKVKEA
jgi:hypothetical protein